ncbi:MAG: diguanylate cyclase [Rhodobacteraceae bacterium]|nr:diguanylate cyclase [Paracoccaceae bacterium]
MTADGVFLVAGKILIVDDVATNRIVLKVKLASAYYETLQAATGAEALAITRRDRPDLILLDLELPDMSGIDICATLKADPRLRDIPVIMITAFQNHERRIQALRAGAEDMFWKPYDEAVLLARIRSLLRARETQDQLGLRDMACRDLGFAEPAQSFSGPGLIGLVAGRIDMALHWKRQLRPHLRDRLLVLDRDAALSELSVPDSPDAFLVASDLQRTGDGLRFMSELRSRPGTRHAAICLAMAPAARDLAATALDLGAADLIDPAADPAEIALRLQKQMVHKRQADALRTTVADGLRLAMIDPLTSLHNRRYGLPHLARIAERAGDSGRSFAVLVIDIDRFKMVNDSWGHAAGDSVLAEVARRLKADLRTVDLLARIGGEEFMAVLPDSDIRAAHAAAERLRRTVGDQPMRLPGGRQISVTISIGLAMGGGLADPLPDAEAILAQADHALLAAKAEGRNQVTVHRSAA